MAVAPPLVRATCLTLRKKIQAVCDVQEAAVSLAVAPPLVRKTCFSNRITFFLGPTCNSSLGLEGP